MLNYKKYGLRKALIGYMIVIVLTLVVCITSIFVFTFTLSPKLKGIWSVLVFLVIPLLYGLVGILLYKKIKPRYDLLDKKKQFEFDVCLQIIGYIVIMLVLFSIFLLILYLPTEKKGVNNEPLELRIQPYTLGNNSSLTYNETEFIKTKQIYSMYNITLHINKPITIEKDINENDTTSILSQNCSFLNELYNLTNRDNKTIHAILINYNGTAIDGMASICGNSNLILMSSHTTISAGWVLAHETGHTLNAKIACWKFNLMKEYSGACYEKGIFYGANWITHDFIRGLEPDFLNQNQVDTIVSTIKNLNNLK